MPFKDARPNLHTFGHYDRMRGPNFDFPTNLDSSRQGLSGKWSFIAVRSKLTELRKKTKTQMRGQFGHAPGSRKIELLKNGPKMTFCTKSWFLGSLLTPKSALRDWHPERPDGMVALISSYS